MKELTDDYYSLLLLYGPPGFIPGLVADGIEFTYFKVGNSVLQVPVATNPLSYFGEIETFDELKYLSTLTKTKNDKGENHEHNLIIIDSLAGVMDIVKNNIIETRNSGRKSSDYSAFKGDDWNRWLEGVIDILSGFKYSGCNIMVIANEEEIYKNNNYRCQPDIPGGQSNRSAIYNLCDFILHSSYDPFDQLDNHSKGSDVFFQGVPDGEHIIKNHTNTNFKSFVNLVKIFDTPIGEPF